MSPRLPFNKRDRHRLSQSGLGYRQTNNWGSGDLPAPWAEGDIVRLVGEPNDRIDEPYSEFYVVSYVTSIDEGDAWYCRVSVPDGTGYPGRSDRLHIGFADRSEYGEDVDFMACFELVDTADPEGLAERERLLAAGWSYEKDSRCPACGAHLHHRCNPLTSKFASGRTP